MHLYEGFDFLGFNVRRYPREAPDQAIQGGGRADPGNGCAPRCGNLCGANSLAVIAKLNPILRGWAAYYRTAVSKQVFASIDHTLVWTMLKWGRHRHETKSYRWIVNRYFRRAST